MDGVNMRGCDLRGVGTWEQSFVGADLLEARVDPCFRLPRGWNRSRAGRARRSG